MLHTPQTRTRLGYFLTLVLACACAWAVPAANTAPATARAEASEKSQPAGPPAAECGADAYGQLPLRFEPNRGQTDERVRFVSRLGGFDLFLTPGEAVFALHGRKASALRMKLAGASDEARGSGLEALPGVSNYFKGKDPSKWRTNVPHFARVQFADVYPGVDVVYYGKGPQLEYDFRLAPGADPRAISMEFDGARRLRLDARGDLLLRTPAGEVRLLKPVAYQENEDGGRNEVSARFVVRGGRVRFRLGEYDATRALVIDPCVMYATFLGGDLDDRGLGVGADSQGHAYVAGITTSLNFPELGGANNAINGNGTADAFVAKLSPDGTALVWATYFGGSLTEDARDIAVDPGGNAYITGITDSFDLPTVNAIQSSKGSTNAFIDAYVAKLSPAGGLVYSTYLGGWRPDQGEAIAADSSGSAYVTGSTGSNNTGNASLRPFPITGGAYQPNFALVNAGGGNSAAFVTKLTPSGGLDYSTFLGGLGNPSGSTAGDSNPDDFGFGVAVDSRGSAYVAGRTESERFPTTAGAAQATYGGGLADAFLAKLSASGSSLEYSTFLGGAGEENRTVGAVAVDPSGNAYVAGGTNSTNFPTRNPLQANYSGSVESDAFLAKLDEAGAFVYSTYIGANNFRRAYGVAADDKGVAYVTGTNTLRRVSANGSSLLPTWSPGGEGRNVVLDQQGNIYVAGTTVSTATNKCTAGNFCPTAGAFQPNPGGSTNDAFVMKFRGDRQPFQIAGYTFDADAAVDDVTLNSTPLASGQACSAVNYTGTTTLERVRDALSDACPATSTLGEAKFETHFTNNRVVNLDGPDLVVFEIGGGAGNEPFTLEVFDPATGQFTAPRTVTPAATNFNDCANLRINAAAIDLDEFGIAPGAYVSRLRFDNLWVANVTSAGAEISDVLALHSAGLNNAPVADAGPDQTVRETNGSASFTLDGSASSDPDGDTLTYVWKDAAGNVVGNSAQLTLSRAPGVYVFTLTVDDGRGGTATDAVQIFINPTAGSQAVVFTNAADFDAQASEQITFDPLDERTAQSINDKFASVSSLTIAGGQAGIRHTSQHARNFAGEGTEGGPVSGEYRVDWGYSAESAVTVTFATPVDSVGAFFGGVITSASKLVVTFEDGRTLEARLFPHLQSVPNGSTACEAINGLLGVDSNGGPRIVKARFSVANDASSLDSIYFGQALGGSHGPGPTRTAESPYPQSCGQAGVQPIVFTNAEDFESSASEQITFDPADERTAQSIANKFDAVSAFTIAGGQAAIRHTSQHAINFAGEGTEGGPVSGEYRIDWGYSGESAVTVTFAAPVDSVGAFFGGVGELRPGNLAVTFEDGKTLNTSALKYLPAVPNGSTECQAINGFLGVDSNGGPKIVKARFTSSSDASSLDSIHFGRAAGGTHGPGPTRTAESPFGPSCAASVTPKPIVPGGPWDGTHVGPGTPGVPGRVTFPISGIGTPGCTIRATVEDHHHVVVGVFTTVVGADGTWTLILDIEDCDVTIHIVQICGGVESEEVARFVYVDGTPPVFNGGLLDEVHYLGGGTPKATVTLNGGAFDLNTSHCKGCGTLQYEWYLIGSGGTRIEVGSSGTLLDLGGGPGSGLSIELPPGEYTFEVVVKDEFGNQSVSRCVHRIVVAEMITINGGLPEAGGFYGPGTPGTPGRVRRTVTGKGNPECSVNFTVGDPAHPDSESNNRTYTTSVDTSGNWSLDLELEDGHPFVQVVQTCGGVAVETVTRQIFVDGTPPAFTGGGLADGVDYVTAGGGTFALTLDGSASDPDTYQCEGNCGGLLYEWYLIGGGGSRTLLGGAGGGELLSLGGGPGSGLRIDLAPGVYEFELVVKDPAGNLLVKRGVRRVLRPLAVTGGLPADGGIYGPGTPGVPGIVTRTLTGTGEPGCTVSVAVSDQHMPESTRNNQTYTTTVGADGNWSLVLTLDDCHPLIVVSQSCESDGGGGGSITRRVYVDGTPAAFTSGGIADADVYVGSGGGTGRIVLDGGASDAGSDVPGNSLTYEWYAVGGDGSRTPLCANCSSALTLDRPLGDYDFEVVVTDTAGNKTSDACHVRVLKRPTTIECQGLTVDFAGLASLSSTLKDALTGEVIEGRSVTYKVAGVSVPNPFEAYLSPGTYPVEVNFAGDDLYQASASAGDCPLVVRSTPGKITGGGSVDEGVRNFGFVAQTKSKGGATVYTGSLEFHDKSKGYNLHSQSITVIAVSADRLHGVFTGTATVNGQTGYTFKAWVDDLGEPGAGVDKFRVEINGPDGFHYDSNTYATLGGKLDQGGNIQIHKSN